MTFGAGITVTVLRSPGRDGHGDPLPSVAHAVAGCGVAPRGGKGRIFENDDRGEEVTVGLTLLAPAGADILATDRVQIAGAPFAGTYDVMGRPAPMVSPFSGWAPGMTVALEDVEG